MIPEFVADTYQATCKMGRTANAIWDSGIYLTSTNQFQNTAQHARTAMNDQSVFSIFSKMTCKNGAD
jgi:hypothetical protein